VAFERTPVSSVLVAGNSVLDLHLAVGEEEDSFEPGWSGKNVGFLDTAPEIVLGGNGAATAYVLGQLGVPVTLNSSIGQDVLGDVVEQWLTGVGVTLARPRSGRSPVNVVRSRGSDGARLSSFYPGEKIDWETGLNDASVGWFFTSGYGGVLESDFKPLVSAFEMAKSKGMRVAFDPGPWFSRCVEASTFRASVPQLDVLTGTEDELSTWSDAKSAAELIDDFIELGARRVIVKLGKEGAAFGGESGSRGEVRGRPMEGVHAVGAGDTFNGTLMAGLVRSQPLAACVESAVERAERAVRSGRGVLGAFEQPDR
jgi:fructokinase